MEVDMSPMTIGKTARAAGVGVETIRFYERKGLIVRPPRPETGFRTYDQEVVRRIRFIRQGQKIGFSLREIDELLALRADPSANSSDVRDRAVAKLDEVESKMRELGRIRAALRDLIAACPGRGALRKCSILKSLTDADERDDDAGRGRARPK